MGGRRRRRHGRHWLPEHVQGDPAESPQRQGADARYPGLLEHRRSEFPDAPSPMPGGGDMNVFGAATQGKVTREEDRRRDLPGRTRIAFLSRRFPWLTRPSSTAPFWTVWSIAAPCIWQAFTTCQPEHGVADDMALTQAQRVRDSRGVA